MWASDGQGACMGFSCRNVFACNMRLQQNTVFLRDASVSQSSQREGKLFGGKRFMNGASGIPARKHEEDFPVTAVSIDHDSHTQNAIIL